MLQSFRKFGLSGLIPVVVWLFTQLFMTGVFLPTNAEAGIDSANAVLSGKVLICSPSGLKYVSLSEDGSIVEEKNDDPEFCPWYRHFADTPPLLLPSSWLISTGQADNEGAWTTVQTEGRYPLQNTRFQSRAPPL